MPVILAILAAIAGLGGLAWFLGNRGDQTPNTGLSSSLGPAAPAGWAMPLPDVVPSPSFPGDNTVITNHGHPDDSPMMPNPAVLGTDGGNGTPGEVLYYLPPGAPKPDPSIMHPATVLPDGTVVPPGGATGSAGMQLSPDYLSYYGGPSNG